ncbi:MAG: hypothetical protein OHK0012_09480 [Synechococcales cyanobacterium]
MSTFAISCDPATDSVAKIVNVVLASHTLTAEQICCLTQLLGQSPASDADLSAVDMLIRALSAHRVQTHLPGYEQTVLS